MTAELAAIVKMMMASDPRRRYQTAEILIRDLLVVANSLGLRGMSSEGLMWLSAQNSSDTFWERHASWLATAVGLLLIVGYLQYYNSTKEGAPLASFGTDDDPHGAIAKSDQGKTATKPESSPRQANSTNNDGQNPEDFFPSDEMPENGPSTESSSIAANESPRVSPTGSELDPSVVPIPKTNGVDPLTDPSRVFANALEPGVLGPIPLVPTRPMGAAVYGPREIHSEVGSATSGTGGNGTTSVRPPVESTETITGEPPAENPGPTSPPSPAVAVATPDSINKPAPDVTSQSPIVVIKSDGSPEQPFPTLEAACAVAQDGNVIELRFNGQRTESPLRIRNKITIRAAKGFRPVIEFVPKEIPAAGYETRMMTISGGALDLVDVSLLLNVKPSIATDLWALVSTQRAPAVRLQRVMVTVQNTAQRPATVVEFRPSSSRMVADMEMMNSGQMSSAMTVLVKDSMVRGGTDLFQVKSFLSARIDLDNCLLALDGTVLRSQGSVDVPEKQTELALRLNQLTAALNSGLIVMEGGEAPRKLGRVSVEATNNIFTRDPSPEHQVPPFILMTSSEPQDDLLKLLAWNGQKNFYDGFDSYLTRTAQDGSKTSVWNYTEWKSRWDSHEVDPHASIVLWKKRWSDKNFSDLTPSDFALDESATGNPALSAANDGGNAGVDLSRLLKLNGALPTEAAVGSRVSAIP